MKVKPDSIKPTYWDKQLSSDVDLARTSLWVTSLKGDIIYNYKRHSDRDAVGIPDLKANQNNQSKWIAQKVKVQPLPLPLLGHSLQRQQKQQQLRKLLWR